MQDAADQAAPEETGGALMGYETEGGLVVTHLVAAGPRATRSRTHFYPDARYQHAEIHRIYHYSRRVSTYIGDWHTHPFSSTKYSIIDRRAMARISADPASRCSRPVMVILGGEDPWQAVAWRYTPRRWWGAIRAMEIQQYG